MFFVNDTATTESYTLSLHDALPIAGWPTPRSPCAGPPSTCTPAPSAAASPTRCTPWRPCSRACTTTGGGSPCPASTRRSEEHTSELQSRQYLVCRLLLEKKKLTSKRTSAPPQFRSVSARASGLPSSRTHRLVTARARHPCEPFSACGTLHRSPSVRSRIC